MSKAFFLALGALLLVTNCSHVVMTQPQATMENTQRLRGGNYSPVQVGTFTIDPRLPESDDKSMSIRGGNSVTSPNDGSFTQYLKTTLAEELKVAGLLDPKSNIIITGSLIGSELHANIGTATGQLKARFIVTRDGSSRYDRELTASDNWESSFMGAVAIPAARNHYQGLFRKMVGVLLDDKDFQVALAK